MVIDIILLYCSDVHLVYESLTYHDINARDHPDSSHINMSSSMHISMHERNGEQVVTLVFLNFFKIEKSLMKL